MKIKLRETYGIGYEPPEIKAMVAKLLAGKTVDYDDADDLGESKWKDVEDAVRARGKRVEDHGGGYVAK